MNPPSDDLPIPPPPFTVPNQSSDAPPAFPGLSFGQATAPQSFGAPGQDPYPGQQTYPVQQAGGYPQFPGQPPFGYQGYGSPFAGATRTSGMAVASMVLGICGAFLFCFFAVAPLLATVFGAVALGQIRRSQGTVTGRGMAIAGLVLGIIGIGLFVLVLAVGNFDFAVND